MVQEGEGSAAAGLGEASASHQDDPEPADSQPVAERDPSERYCRVQPRSRAYDSCCSLEMSGLKVVACWNSLILCLDEGRSRQCIKVLMRRKVLRLLGIKSG